MNNDPSGIQPIPGEHNRFHVPSSSSPDPYLVDLDEFDGNGFCGCLHFENRMLPKLAEAQERRTKVDQPLRCKHIIAAQKFVKDNPEVGI